MDKKSKIIGLLLLMLPFCFIGQAEAYSFNNDSCSARCCGCFSFTPKIGVAPATYGCSTDRYVDYCNTAVFVDDGCAVPDGATQTELDTLSHKFSFPKFEDKFEYPWQVGFEIEYNPTECVGVFVDISYTQARGKSNHYDLSDTINFATTCDSDDETELAGIQSFDFRDEFREEYDDLKEFQGYLGCRYYSSRCCGAALFFGSKIGVKWRSSLDYRLEIRETTDGERGDLIDHGEYQYFDNHLVFSGGFHLGLDYEISPCCAVILQVEAVASGCYKTNDRKTNRTFVSENLETEDGDTVSYITSRKITGGNAGTVINFPITVGTQLTF